MRALSCIRPFENMSDLVDSLSGTIVERLSRAVAQRGRASLVVPGGETPKHLFDGLAGRHAPWSQVDIVLSDERWAPESVSASNERNVRERLLKGRAAAARFTSFRLADGLPQARDLAEIAITHLAHPFDVAIVGMGEDGHIASLFPEASVLHAGALVAAVECPGSIAPRQRLTLTLQALQTARFVAVIIAGGGKFRALGRAAAGEPTPMNALLRARRGQVEVFSAP